MEIESSITEAEDRQVIEAYGGGGFRIGGQSYGGSVLVRPDRAMAWPVRRVEEATVEGLARLWEDGEAPEVLLLGCGPRMVFPLGDLRRLVREAGPVLELMDTGAACRTYNLLASEGRKVAAALIAVE